MQPTHVHVVDTCITCVMTHVLHVSDPCATLAGRNPCTTWVLPMYYMGGQIPDVAPHRPRLLCTCCTCSLYECAGRYCPLRTHCTCRCSPIRIPCTCSFADCAGRCLPLRTPCTCSLPERAGRCSPLRCHIRTPCTCSNLLLFRL